MYTDGSFSTNYGSLAGIMDLEHGNKETHANVIVMDASPDWRRLLVLGLQITGNEITADNAYIIEMLALATGYSLTEYEVSREGSQSDCVSARQVILDGHVGI